MATNNDENKISEISEINENLEKNDKLSISEKNEYMYTTILSAKYKVQELKIIAKSYNLKISGTKSELINRIYFYLKSSIYILKIQRVFRGWLQRKCNNLHGPAYKCRNICNNDTDFLSGDEIKNIDNNQFFSYTDSDNFTYGFDIVSLFNLIINSKNHEVKNPYNRNTIDFQVIYSFNRLIKISNALKKNIILEMETIVVSQEKSIELKVIELFQQINLLGNYSEYTWFLSLTKPLLVKFIRELSDIWFYRAQITIETKKAICPMHDPFNFFNFNYILHENNLDKIRLYILHLLSKLVNSGINRDNKALGACYILGALTLVNSDAAESLPWLYQSFSYF